MQTIDDLRARIRAECEGAGISGARGMVKGYEHDKFIVGVVLTWIDEFERREAEVREVAQRLLNEKSLAAAQLAAETSASAAEASRISARWTMWAAFAAAASALVSLAQLFK